jgi:hypothetical protein
VRSVAVLADDLCAIGQSRVDQDCIARGEAVGAGAEHSDDAGAVSPEDARLRYRRETLADPEVEMVESCRPQADEDFPGAGCGILDVLVPEDLGTPVLVDPDRLHGAIVTRLSRCYRDSS